MRRIVMSGAGIMLASAVAQAVPVGYTGGMYSQNFDAALAPILTAGVVTEGVAGGTAWGDGVTVAGWNFLAEGALTQFGATWASSGGTVTNQQNRPLTVGSSGTFGSAPISDRALGAQTVAGTAGTLAAGTARAPQQYSLTLRNDSASTLANVTFQYSAELWRVPTNETGTTDGLNVSYKFGVTPTDGAAAELATATSGWTAVAAANYVQTTPPNTIPAVQLDGNLALNTTVRGATITGLNWLPGNTLTLRWSDPALDSGSLVLNTTMAIDDVTFSATVVPEAGGAAPLTLAAALLVRRRRSL